MAAPLSVGVYYEDVIDSNIVFRSGVTFDTGRAGQADDLIRDAVVINLDIERIHESTRIGTNVGGGVFHD